MNYKKYWIKFFIISIFLISTLFPAISYAKKTVSDAPGMLDQTIVPTGIEKTDVVSIVAMAITVLLTLVGMGFLILMVYAGIIWTTARGNDDKTETAKKTIIAAVIGLVIVVSAYAISNLIFTRLTSS